MLYGKLIAIGACQYNEKCICSMKYLYSLLLKYIGSFTFKTNIT